MTAATKAEVPVPRVVPVVVQAHIDSPATARKLAVVFDELLGLHISGPGSSPGNQRSPLAWFLRDVVDALTAYADGAGRTKPAGTGGSTHPTSGSGR